MRGRAAFIGLDLGTSGCRAVAIDAAAAPLAEARSALPDSTRPAPGRVEQHPEDWWQTLTEVLRTLVAALPDHRPAALAVAATSPTLLLADAAGDPLGPALMYDDQSAHQAGARIAARAPTNSVARGPGSGLAKLLALHDRLAPTGPYWALHQADWVTARFTGTLATSDWHNALKLGHDPEQARWPEWVGALLPPGVRLPQVLAPGAVIAPLAPAAAAATGLPPTTQVVAGTTDSTAAALAAGLARPGEALTSLGTTLVVKVVSPHRIEAPEHGVYSHRYGAHWLVGGGSNSGAGVLRREFDDATLATLSARIDPEHDSGLDYYPLPGIGERFPRPDPHLAPRLEPHPGDPVHRLHGLLEGIARIEAEGYARLAELGAPTPQKVLSIGGGARNPTWTRLRARLLGCSVLRAPHQEAALGAALLARGAGVDT
ncbi:FGGY-family carbohydrate kinase [Marichromatium bheemlicum]|uniref:FGGY-family carbohydrate kinase n=1 Tax=Marichromatium bheemlicum TaxID=365339 RepID=A0ABX1I675_9GAMM|nr:FGGY-family carbohydrate kinase [Marichromatium bheemlicum]NKN31737.1 FGGY-family carbohydrate kinase [Marichromatium bheemlicum]